MRLAPFIIVLSLFQVAAGEAVAGDVFAVSEGDALAHLVTDPATPVFDCTGCDVDQPGHRVTQAFILRLLEEFRTNGVASRGVFLLRERVRPRFHVDAPDGVSNGGPAPDACQGGAWGPSVTLWDYDLRQAQAAPRRTACFPATARSSAPPKIRCSECDLHSPLAAERVQERLLAFHQALAEEERWPRSGRVYLFDDATSGYRYFDYRAYPGALYLGPAGEDYYRLPTTDTESAPAALADAQSGLR